MGSPRPALNWRLAASRPAVLQRAYEIQVAEDPEFSQGPVSSGAIVSSSPIAAPWPATALRSRDIRWARVRLWTDQGVTGWSAPLRIEAALLSSADWTARPVSPVSNVDCAAPRSVPLLRRAFNLDQPIVSARLYVTAQGVQQTWINGQPLDDALLEPGWTAYGSRLLYAAYDVTDRLTQGENVLAAAVGDGWWRGWLSWMERRAVYGATTALLAQLEVRLADGSVVTVGTDETWRGGTGELLLADIYNGSTRDFRAEPAGWRLPGFQDRDWERVVSLALPPGLALRTMPPVCVIERWPAESKRLGDHLYRVDTGQNLAGFLRLRVTGPAGATITIRHAEVLDGGDRLYTAPLRNALATDSYVLADGAEALLEPAFTFHGFRYADIQVEPGVAINSVEVCAVASDLRQIGSFGCSDERLNQLFSNVRWSQLANFLALPTDCPQRDERLGWTGDIQVFASTACTNSDARTFLASWLRDLAIEQRADGNVPSTVPNVIQGHEFEYGGVGWGDAATLVPWAIYQAYGDAAVLRDQFTSMRAWVDWGASRRTSDGTWQGDFHLGDWLDPGAPSDRPHLATTEADFIATAYLAHSARVLGQTADIIGEPALAGRYDALAREVAQAAWERWADHAVTTQAGCAIALQFGIAPTAERMRVGQALAAIVARNGFRIGTGFLGTPLVLPALTACGQLDTAYRLLLNEECPGWLYQVARGATTMWERWDAIGEDGSLHAGEMASGESDSMISFNHYAYGAVAEWLYASVAGIAPGPERPGYEHIAFSPRPGGGLRHAHARVATPFGPAAIVWKVGDGGELAVDIEVPPGARGVFSPPPEWTGSVVLLDSGTHRQVLSRRLNG